MAIISVMAIHHTTVPRVTRQGSGATGPAATCQLHLQLEISSRVTVVVTVPSMLSQRGYLHVNP